MDVDRLEGSKEGLEVLHTSSFTIPSGMSTAIVGPSGAGKSTIIQLIQRFYNLSEGQIKIDNTNINDINLAALRDQIGYVS